MEKFSANLSYKEGVHSNTATRKGIVNTPNADELAAMKLVATKVFQPLRDWHKKPIRVTSFFRSVELNSQIGGSSKSQHCLGEAIDIDTTSDNKKLYEHIRDNVNIKYDKLIWEFGNDDAPDWIHVSYREKNNRNEQYRAVKVNGKTVYKPIK